MRITADRGALLPRRRLHLSSYALEDIASARIIASSFYAICLGRLQLAYTALTCLNGRFLRLSMVLASQLLDPHDGLPRMPITCPKLTEVTAAPAP